MLKRPCTWTKTYDILAKRWQSLGFLPECSYPITGVVDPATTSYITEAARDDVEKEDDEV
jgi:hypothetical protein